jgi:hypothetical protein
MQFDPVRRRSIKLALGAGVLTTGGCATSTQMPNSIDPANREVRLDWPQELARKPAASDVEFVHRGTNVVLDFHGDLIAAKLVVFSDGNHHMALEASLQKFLTQNPEVGDIFYCTAPPRVPSALLEFGRLHIGNLTLSVRPHVFISPPNVLSTLAQKKLVEPSRPMMKSRGNVFLVRKGNPKQILTIADIARENVRLFLSNPKTENASYVVYKETLQRLARKKNISLSFLESGDSENGKASSKIFYGSLIHHREAPEAVAGGQADVALIYYHLALRYKRVFPQEFEIVFPDGSFESQPASPDHVISSYNIALVGDGGAWGAKFMEHMLSPQVRQIYEYHGLAKASAV